MFHRKRFHLRLRSRKLLLGERTLVMGILNITPDSFSDGGKYLDSQAAVAHALRLEQEGADILDIGGESTRPGASPITLEEELRRILPVIQVLRGKLRIPISVDTRRAGVAEAALNAGADTAVAHDDDQSYTWRRAPVVEGIELHIRDDLPAAREEAVIAMREAVRAALGRADIR